MQISFHPSYNCKPAVFGAKASSDTSASKYSEKEIRTAKTKKAVSECATVVVGAGILYFAMKHNFKINKIKNHQKKMQELAGFIPPTIKLNPDHLDEFLKV